MPRCIPDKANIWDPPAFRYRCFSSGDKYSRLPNVRAINCDIVSLFRGMTSNLCWSNTEISLHQCISHSPIEHCVQCSFRTWPVIKHNKNPQHHAAIGMMMRIIGLVAVSIVSDRGDSNARPLRPERSALPTALLSERSCLSQNRVQNYEKVKIRACFELCFFCFLCLFVKKVWEMFG